MIRERIRRVAIKHLAVPSEPTDLGEIETFVRWLLLQGLLVAVLGGSYWFAQHLPPEVLVTLY